MSIEVRYAILFVVRVILLTTILHKYGLMAGGLAFLYAIATDLS